MKGYGSLEKQNSLGLSQDQASIYLMHGNISMEHAVKRRVAHVQIIGDSKNVIAWIIGNNNLPNTTLAPIMNQIKEIK
jgi:hypothetical protein